MALMKAAIFTFDDKEDLGIEITNISVPIPKSTEALIQVKSAGINHADMYTLRERSPDVQIPIVPGIEAVGVVVEAPAGEFEKGDMVMTCLGTLGTQRNGAYAEFICVPAKDVLRLPISALSWSVLGAIPLAFSTAWGSLFKALKLQRGEKLLIRGGTSSVGLIASEIACYSKIQVYSTSRKVSSTKLIRDYGALEMFVDSGRISEQVKSLTDGGVDKVLDLIGVTTLKDSLNCVKTGGMVCIAGSLGGSKTLEGENLLDLIPNGVALTTYKSNLEDLFMTPFDDIVTALEVKDIKLPIGKIFQLDNIAEAHRMMKNDSNAGKMVLLTEPRQEIGTTDCIP